MNGLAPSLVVVCAEIKEVTTKEPHSLLLAVLFMSTAFTAAMARDQEGTEIRLPESCVNETQMPGNMSGMGDMSGMMDSMHQNMSGQMSEAAKGYMQAMAAMHRPMMQGAMALDPDVAFSCSMIAHHLGAIAMARVQLQHGNDEAARKMARKTIDGQSKEVDEMTKWVDEHLNK